MLRALVAQFQPDLIDIHEEPFSAVAHQMLAVAPASMAVVIYTAQNIDKRFPPPFAQCERAAYRRVTAMYPCSSQAAAVARGKGFSGLIEVLPLGYDDTLFVSGSQSLDADELVIGLVGRLVPEKGVLDAVQVLAMLQTHRPAIYEYIEGWYSPRRRHSSLCYLSTVQFEAAYRSRSMLQT
jgi:glycosyltransferase involved in cell wall biosynthesis